MLKEFSRSIERAILVAFLIVPFLFPLIVLEGSNPALTRKEESKICLTLIIKNEQDVIERCLKSVKEIVDYICIFDVGSSDDTINLVKDFMLENGIPGKVFKNAWHNFGYNRTLAVETAQKTMQEKGFNLAKTYLLVMDADMELKQSSTFNKASLFNDCYSLPVKSAAFCCYRYDVHLLRASMDWQSIGVVNDYWSHKGMFHNTKLHSLMIDDHADGDYTAERRDISLMIQVLEDEPGNTRNMFYLAQRYRCLNNLDEAIKLYQSCAEKKDDHEQVWFSKYMLGECFEEKGYWDHALFWYLEAFQYDPLRAEPLLKVATHYRERAQNDLACIFAKYGSVIPYSDEQSLFQIPPETDYQFDQELSIAAYYTRFRDDGYVAASDLLLRRNVPWYIKERTANNLLFYVENLKNVHFRPIVIDFPLIEEGFDERYHPMNPSIQKTDHGYKVICRTVNYTQIGAKIFNTIDSGGVFRTKNFLVHYDFDFNLLSQQEIVENLPREKLQSCNVAGLEDCRLFDLNDESWFTCTTSDTNPTGVRQISLCKLAKGNGDKVYVEMLVPLNGPDPYRCEKNWLPFIQRGNLYAIYSSDPFLIYQIDVDTGNCIPVIDYEPTHDFTRFRGSAAPIEFDGGYLMMVHEVVLLPDYSRCYLHRFVSLDKGFKVQQVSKPFTFQHLGVEFCCNMILDHMGTQLIMAVGIEDREGYLCTIDLDQVRSLLRPLPVIYTKSSF